MKGEYEAQAIVSTICDKLDVLTRTMAAKSNLEDEVVRLRIVIKAQAERTAGARRAMADVQNAEADIRKVMEVARAHGWKSIDNNGQILWQFLDSALADNGQIIESQKLALAEWRRKADEDTGRLSRYQGALSDLAHRYYNVADDDPAALPFLRGIIESLTKRARRELEGTVIHP